MIEKTAKRTLKWVWDEMKENARKASDALPSEWREVPDHELPGGSVCVAKLRQYLDEHPDVPTEIHLVGHSAGSIFLTGIINQLKTAGIQVESLTYLAAAIRTDEWMTKVLPRLRQGDIKRFTAFGMSPTRELDDCCGTRSVAVYRKSLLYLVSRAFERPTSPDATEVPLVGMAHFAEDIVGRTSYAEAVESLKNERGTLIWSPSAKPVDSASDSASHGGFDDDEPTMTSVLLRILGSKTLQPRQQVRAQPARRDSGLGGDRDRRPASRDRHQRGAAGGTHQIRWPGCSHHAAAGGDPIRCASWCDRRRGQWKPRDRCHGARGLGGRIVRRRSGKGSA